jgi:hypothetical protein
LVKEALQLCTNNDPYGYTRSGNVSIPELLNFFTTSAKSRDQRSLLKLIKSHNLALKNIAKVDKYIRNANPNHDIKDDNDSEFNSDSGVDEVFTSVKKMDYGAKRSIKKQINAHTPKNYTLASATVGVEQKRLKNKRKHKPTIFFGTRYGGSVSHIIASCHPTLSSKHISSEQRQHGNELLLSTEGFFIKESSSVQDDFINDVPSSNDFAAYDSDVNSVFPKVINNDAYNDNKSESSYNIENVNDGVAGSVIFSDDSYANAEFWGIRSNEFEACFDHLPADNGHMYFEAGCFENDYYGPLMLTEIIVLFHLRYIVMIVTC